ncbi:MAG: GNAT family N-acetyltransferase [Proteobacteria bacterium]|nr:GNAT family N-acetyltransferase [Pseudomonadota bacterium]
MGRLNSPVSLTAVHQTAGFDCGFDSLNEWLTRRALKNEHGVSRTYVVCDSNQVVGFYAISAGSIVRREAPGLIRRNMPDPIPALILGRLAVDHRFQGVGIGQGLLKDAVSRSISVSEQVGARVLIVHALNDKAEAFSLKHGFIMNLLIPNTLLLPLK